MWTIPLVAISGLVLLVVTAASAISSARESLVPTWTTPPDVASGCREHAGRPCAAAAARHIRRREIGLGSMVGAGISCGGPRGRGGGAGSAPRAGGRRRGRLLQRNVVGATGRAATRSPAAPTCTGASGSVSSGVTPPGWSFVVGKTASCAAMALTVGAYVWPDGHTRWRSPPWWR